MSRRSDIFEARQRFIDRKQRALVLGGSELEKRLMDLIMREFIALVEREKGVIVSNGENITLTSAIDRLFDDFIKNDFFQVADTLVNDFAKISSFNEDYYELFEPDKNRYKDIRKEVREFMRQRIGITTSNTLEPKGFLDRLVSDPTLRNELKTDAIKAITGSLPLNEYIQQVQFKITGAEGVNGAVSKYLETFAYDAYAQFDRASNKAFAQKLELTCFIYSGGLIETSRDFCIKHNNKVFTDDEAALWVDDPDLPRTKAEKESGVVNYIPTIDMGRWRCRHLASYISDELALHLRPDLKVYFDAREKLKGAA